MGTSTIDTNSFASEEVGRAKLQNLKNFFYNDGTHVSEGAVLNPGNPDGYGYALELSNPKYNVDKDGWWQVTEVPTLAPLESVLGQTDYTDTLRDNLKDCTNRSLSLSQTLNLIGTPLVSGGGFVDFWAVNTRADFGWDRGQYFAQQATKYADYLLELATGDLSAQINTLSNPMLAGLEEARRREVARAQTKYTAANGFFNSGIAALVADIDFRYATLKAEKAAELAAQFRQAVYGLANNLVNTMLNYRNPTVADAIAVEQHRLMSTLEVNRAQQANWAQTAQSNLTLVAYARDEVNRLYSNSKQVRDRKLLFRRWEAEYLQLMSNVPGNGQGGSMSMVESIANTAMAGVNIATGVARIAAGDFTGALSVGGGVAQLAAGAGAKAK